jgi:hypothetical protein
VIIDKADKRMSLSSVYDRLFIKHIRPSQSINLYRMKNGNGYTKATMNGITKRDLLKLSKCISQISLNIA